MIHTATAPTQDEHVEVCLQREHLVGQIAQLNPTARIEWLGRFDDTTLRDYLDRLEHIAGRRGPMSRWERRGNTPAIMSHEPEEN